MKFDFLFKRLHKKWREDWIEDWDLEFEENMQESDELERDEFDLTDSYQRRRYVQGCLEQIAEATCEIETANSEYGLVDSSLKDIEEVEAMKGEDKRFLMEQAEILLRLEQAKGDYGSGKFRLNDEDFNKMERLEQGAPDGAKKLLEAESYQEAIRQDLQRIEGEKQACIYRRQEATVSLENLRGMALICAFAVVACIFVLLFLQLGLQMDARIGYILTGGAGTLTLTVIYLKYMESRQEVHQAVESINRLITLQNKVKIRYVNNVNLLDYLYTKYDVKSGKQLSMMWEQYQGEKEERDKLKQTEDDLEFHGEQMVRLLKKYRLFDPIIWIHQPAAILDEEEMAKTRRNLILRRQKLRKQLEYNRENAEKGQKQIRELVSDYPQFANEVLKMVSDYEKKYD